ncbi:MAG: hydantoinase/oxoprolinase family protein [Betaproteobacteria bacterium]|nr:hydantoinase/oxoprolinase family protein [Betaproteobacteria bacterium]
MPQKPFRLGVDVGGTFTDFLVVDAEGRAKLHKTPTTPDDPSIGLLKGLEELAADFGLGAGEFAQAIATIVHGMTVATNAVLTRKGARTGLITTYGFRDVLQMRRGYRPERYNNRYQHPAPLVRRRLRRTVRERLDPTGRELEPVDRQDALAAIEFLKTEGVESIAVCFMHSHAGSGHEEEVAALVTERLPEAYLTVSSKLLPQPRIYDRVSTTVINAYVGPVVARYLRSLTRRLEQLGFRGNLLVMQSNGGVAGAAATIEAAASTLLSGPAAAPVAASALTLEHGWKDIVTMDMGGTSFDTALVRDRTPLVTTDGQIDGLPVALSMLDIHTVGAGGGSIAWVDAGGMLRVGPQSAGAKPGPVCYGLGGAEPTCTDADLVLGYLDPDYFLGGRMKLDVRGAREAIKTAIADPLGISVEKAALGIFDVINVNMAEAIREVSVKRGFDPREFPLVVAGGAGPIHCAAIALELGISSIFVPRMSSVLCAAGMVLSDFRHDYVRGHRSLLGDSEAEALLARFQEMRAEGSRQLAAEGIAEALVSDIWSMDLRYPGQHHEVNVEIGEDDVSDPAAIVARFHRRHEQLYGYSAAEMPVEVLTLRLTCIGETRKPELRQRQIAQGGEPAARKGSRPIYLHAAGGFVAVDVCDGDRLGPGSRLAGPLLAESQTMTVVVPPGFALACDAMGNFLLSSSNANGP